MEEEAKSKLNLEVEQDNALRKEEVREEAQEGYVHSQSGSQDDVSLFDVTEVTKRYKSTCADVRIHPNSPLQFLPEHLLQPFQPIPSSCVSSSSYHFSRRLWYPRYFLTSITGTHPSLYRSLNVVNTNDELKQLRILHGRKTHTMPTTFMKHVNSSTKQSWT
jgi:hypothetical protein